jgi:hypothetical protein
MQRFAALAMIRGTGCLHVGDYIRHRVRARICHGDV